MQLRQTKALSAVDDHDIRIRHIDADLDHGGGNERMNIARTELLHGTFFLLR